MTEVEQMGRELEPFIAELFETFVDGPLLTPEQRKSRASDIALSVVEAHVMCVHLAYNAVRARRLAKNLPMGA